MRVYAFGNVTAVLDAEHEITGYHSGDDVISAERAEDGASDVVGADGSMAVAISSNRSGSVTFKLLQTSSSNRYLLQRYALQEAGAATFRPLNLNVKDVHRLDLIQGFNGYLKKLPPVKRGEKVNEQEWVIRFQELYYDLADAGGVGSPSASAEAAG
jgi:hypothetical protein